LKRVVLDTNVVVSAVLWGGAPRTLFDLADSSQIELFSSIAMVRELTEVLARDKFAAKIAISGLSIDQIVDSYCAYVTMVQPQDTPRVAPDPDDDVVLGTALAASAEMIITGDLPFLSVGSCEGVELVSVRQAMEVLGA
jgi:uncharacterized protein